MPGEEVFEALSCLTFQASVNYHKILVSAGRQSGQADAQDRGR